LLLEPCGPLVTLLEMLDGVFRFQQPGVDYARSLFGKIKFA
jgi:hypothetical protein